MNQRKINQSLLLICLSIAGLMPFQESEADIKIPHFFENKSYFDYDIYWSFLKIGSARLSFLTIEAEKDLEERYEIHFSVKSNNLVSSVYPVDNYIISTLLKTGHQVTPLIYEKKSSEGGKRRDSTVTFDYKLKQITEEKNDQKLPPIALVPNLQDPLSLILVICQNDYQAKPNFHQDVSDGGQITNIQSSYLKEETIDTPVGQFDTQVIDIQTQGLRGVFKKSPDAEVILYLSKHRPHIPIKFKSKVRVGSFHAVLSGGIYNGAEIKGTEIAPPKKTNTQTEKLNKRFNRKF